jgi:hypothetical protein
MANLPSIQQALDAAVDLIKSDDAIRSVVIQFQTSTGLKFEAVFDGLLQDVKRIA